MSRLLTFAPTARRPEAARVRETEPARPAEVARPAFDDDATGARDECGRALGSRAMEPEAVERLEDFEELRERGIALVARGEYEHALPWFERALQVAREEQRAGDADLAECNWSAAVVESAEPESDRAREAGSRLRRVTRDSTDAAHICLASYTLARLFERRRSFKKGLFYAQMAQDHAAIAERRPFRAAVHNLRANLLLAESRLDQAVSEYRMALAESDPEDALTRAVIRANLGYCAVLRGDPRSGLSMIIQGDRVQRAHGSPPTRTSAQLDMAYAYLELGRPRYGELHAAKAYRLALRHGDAERERWALYLWGEALVEQGADEAAREVFGLLERDFLQIAGSTEALMQVGLRSVVNLRA